MTTPTTPDILASTLHNGTTSMNCGARREVSQKVAEAQATPHGAPAPHHQLAPLSHEDSAESDTNV